MSLINDALKRANEAQLQAPPPLSPQMQFRPVELAQYPRHNIGVIVPAALAVAALLAVLLIWQLAPGRKATGPREVQVLTPPAASSKIAPQPPAPVPGVVVAAVQPSPPPAPPPAPTVAATSVTNSLTVAAATIPANLKGGVVAPVESVAVAATTPPAKLPEAKEQENVATQPVAVTPPPEPKLPPLKLQAIAFSSKQPLVVINGTMLSVGDKLGDLRVVAIERGSATLVGMGRTNILTIR